ncbi:hypothetical protein A2U01_0084821, partial [Trifolium medium]|nr:hypothetical protein [Trifolium medium]
GFCAAHRLCCAARSGCVALLFFVLLAARRAEVTCAAHRATLFRDEVFWFLRCAQGGAARRAGLVSRVDFC